MIGCAVTDSVDAEKIAALATGDSQAAVQTAVTDLIDAGKIFDEIVPGSRIPDPGSGMRRYALCGRAIDQGAQGHLAVL
jgi:hypothetical protein